MNWKFHLKFNLLLSILGSIAISTMILLRYHTFTFPQLIIDSLQGIVVSFLVGVSVPFQRFNNWLKQKYTLTPLVHRLITTAVSCLVISGVVTLYFKLVIFGWTSAFIPYFIIDYPLSFLTAMCVTLLSEQWITRLLVADSL